MTAVLASTPRRDVPGHTRRQAGWIADTAVAPRIPDVFAAAPKDVSLVPISAVSKRSNMCVQKLDLLNYLIGDREQLIGNCQT
jgi:hypothetical protein